MRKVLLDTQIFLWMATQPDRIPAGIRNGLQSDDHCWILNQTSIWEIQVKYDLHKLPLPKAPADLVPEIIRKTGVLETPITNQAIYMLGKLPPIHRDPFDRLLIAHAITHGWEIATTDPRIAEYAVAIYR